MERSAEVLTDAFLPAADGGRRRYDIRFGLKRVRLGGDRRRRGFDRQRCGQPCQHDRRGKTEFVHRHLLSPGRGSITVTPRAGTVSDAASPPRRKLARRRLRRRPRCRYRNRTQRLRYVTRRRRTDGFIGEAARLPVHGLVRGCGVMTVPKPAGLLGDAFFPAADGRRYDIRFGLKRVEPGGDRRRRGFDRQRRDHPRQHDRRSKTESVHRHLPSPGRGSITVVCRNPFRAPARAGPRRIRPARTHCR